MKWKQTDKPKFEFGELVYNKRNKKIGVIQPTHGITHYYFAVRFLLENETEAVSVYDLQKATKQQILIAKLT